MDIHQKLRTIGLTHDQCSEVYDFIISFSKEMCDKQKMNCFNNALAYKEGRFGAYYYKEDVKVDKKSIITASYPTELVKFNQKL